MTGLLLPFGVAVLLAASALAGPAVLRRAAPALSSTPRFALILLPAVAGLWALTLLALGPMLAWAMSGPALLAGVAGEVCQRCIDAASPFAGQMSSGVPSLILIAPAVVLAFTAALIAALHVLGRSRRSRQLLHQVRRSSSRTRIAGAPVLLTDSPIPVAMSLPGRAGGVVLSTATLRLLEEEELAAVLAHEQTHLRQRHHAIAVITSGLARSLLWVPLVREIDAALPHYLEIAADEAAVRHTGVPAMASALLKLGTRPYAARESAALHAAGPERIGQLIAPLSPRLGFGASLTLLSTLVTFALTSTVVHTLYLAALATGCM